MNIKNTEEWNEQKNIIGRTQFLWNTLLTISTIFCNWCNCKRALKTVRAQSQISKKILTLSGTNSIPTMLNKFLIVWHNPILGKGGTWILSLGQTAREAGAPMLRDLWCSDWMHAYLATMLLIYILTRPHTPASSEGSDARCRILAQKLSLLVRSYYDR